MRIAIVQFPGSNCERETLLAVQRAGMTGVECLWNEPPEKFRACDGFVIVGGFSYEDRSRAGVLAALNPVMQLLKEQNELGKPILGICNGAQILVEAGLVPGLNHYGLALALTDNKRIRDHQILGTGYYNAWVHLKPNHKHRTNAFTRHLLPQTLLHIPVAHAEGRFIIPAALLKEIESHGLDIFHYCNEAGSIIDEFPVNPNGSVKNIAALSNQTGNVLAIMPHPERATAGDVIFHSMRDYIASSAHTPTPSTSPLAYHPGAYAIQSFAKQPDAEELVIELIITDNQAVSVENTLRHQGLAVTIRRQIHWEISCDSLEAFQQIKASDILFNDRKEFVVAHKPTQEQRSFLVRAKEDVIGLQKMQYLKQHFSIDGIRNIRHGVLWHLSAEKDVLDETTQKVLNTHILFNPTSHECYDYV